MNLVRAFVESNVARDGKVHRLLLGGLGAAGGPAAGLSWEVYDEGGHGAVVCWEPIYEIRSDEQDKDGLSSHSWKLELS